MLETDAEDGLSFDWPHTADVPYAVLAAKVKEFCQELNKREAEMREHNLQAALTIWPTLRAALREKGKTISLNGYAEPVLPQWASDPVVPIGNTCFNKPKTKAAAWEEARKNGDGGWATLGELWLWLVDAGPIMERAMRKYGYLMPKA
jgi:hypothetical protein